MDEVFFDPSQSTDNNFFEEEQSLESDEPVGQINGELVVETGNSNGAPDHTHLQPVVNVPLITRRKGGNRRKGPLRAGNRNHLGKNTPASEDPIVQQRREVAARLWNDGMTAPEVQEAVNEWLAREGQEPVSLATIRRDKGAIYDSWELDFDQTSSQARLQHIANLNRMKTEAMQTYRKLLATGKGATTAAVQALKLAIDTEVQLAQLDGSYKRAELHAIQETETFGASRFTRVYLNVDTADLKPDQRATPLIIEGEAKNITLLPPPEEKDDQNR